MGARTLEECGGGVMKGKPWNQFPEQLHGVVAAHPGSILLQTSRFDPSNKRSFLFIDALRTITAAKLEEIPRLFEQIEEALADGLYVAGYMSYEAGYCWERFAGVNLSLGGLPLAWFGVYRNPFVYNHQTGSFEGTPEPPWLESLPATPREGTPAAFADHVEFGLEAEDYRAKIERIKEYIAAGDTYQVNFTSQASVSAKCSAALAFRTLLRQQHVSYAAFLNVDGDYILSLSPELFFRTEQGKIITRPMKGTMPRGLDAAEDARQEIRLRSDEKNRSEHVMIVDLLRNDLGRICTMESVQVEDMFSVERYETLLQMTSTICGTLRPRTGYADIFKSMFPCGSVTGAPKIRTMEIIRELEEGPRGIYTGAIGFMSPDGCSAFNVAIRTIVLQENKASMGVGGGIVADSIPADEYDECLLKTAFLTRSLPGFQLLETMLWDGEFRLLSEHLDRMEASASYFDFAFDRASLACRLAKEASLFRPGDRYRLRMLLNSAGEVTIAAKPDIPDRSTGRIRLSPERTWSGDVFLRHKTTHRSFYDRQYAEAREAGFDEVILMNERGEITEGAISNIFIRKAGRWVTPHVASGLLPGVFRRHLLETEPSAQEELLTIEDLQSADAVFICNSVRGLRQVEVDLYP